MGVPRITSKAEKFIPVLRLGDLKKPPSFAELAEMMKTAERNKDHYVIQSWFHDDLSNERYSLRVFVLAKGRSAEEKEYRGEPEWTLLCGTAKTQKTVWVHNTGDLGLLLNLLLSEHEGRATVSSEFIESSLPQHQWNKQLNSRSISSGADLTLPITPLDVASVKTEELLLPNDGQTPDSTKRQAPIVLAGDIQALELMNVLQSISLCKMTGALMLNRDLEHAAIYFADGDVVHAEVQKGFATAGGKEIDIQGDHAFLEVFTWDSGSFSFEPSRRNLTNTITRKSYALLVEGTMLRDYSDHLKKLAVTDESQFIHTKPDLTETEFTALVKQGLPLDVELQKNVYLKLRAGTSLYELLKNLPMAKATWIPVLFNLINLGLIALKDGGGQTSAPKDDSFCLDEKLIESFYHDLLRLETGICSHAAFSYFVQREYARFVKTKRNFYVVLFEARCKRASSNFSEPLSNEGLREVASRLQKCMGPLDVVGHQNLDFALLLPESKLTNSQEFLEQMTRFVSGTMLNSIGLDDELQLAITLYGPDPDGQIRIKHKISHPSLRPTR